MIDIDNNPELNIEAAIFQTEKFVERMQLQQVTVSTEKSRAGKTQLVLECDKRIIVNAGSGLEQIAEGDTTFLLKQIASTFDVDKKDSSSIDLLLRPAFVESSITELAPGEITPNILLSELFVNKDAIPVFYGSTNGINPAEVMETLICSTDAQERLGRPTEVIFDYSSCDSSKARSIFGESLSALDGDTRLRAFEFIESLGENDTEQQLEAAKIIFEDQTLTFVSDRVVFERIGQNLTIGKLLLLAKLSGGDPVVLDGRKSSEILRLTNRSQQGLHLLTSSVSESRFSPGGFTYYAREAVLGADVPGSQISPLKLTDKANIYKILEGYNALYSQKRDGVILSPIQRQRMQVPSQIEKQSGDPIDIRVLAFLAVVSPSEFSRLANDFRDQCRVLTPKEAILNGTKDNRFDLSRYFKQVK